MGNNAQGAVAAKVEATGGRYHASMVLAIALKPRQNMIHFGNEIRRALINTVAGSRNPHHERIDTSMLQRLVVLFGFTDGGSVVEVAGQQQRGGGNIAHQ